MCTVRCLVAHRLKTSIASPAALLLATAQLGAVTYACRIPERWYPGKFDIAGHSHQLWHAAVVLAAWVHYLAIMILLQWRDAAGGCAITAAGGGTAGTVTSVRGCSGWHCRKRVWRDVPSLFSVQQLLQHSWAFMC